MRKAIIPGSVTNIHPKAFEECRKLTIHAPAGSCAEAFAKGNPKRFNFAAEEQLAGTSRPCADMDAADQGVKRIVKRSKLLEDTWNAFAAKTPAQVKKEWGVESGADGLVITKYKGEEISFVIPGNIGGKAVVRLADDSFRASCSLESGKKSAYNKKMYKTKAVIVEEGIMRIGAAAFAGCVFMTDICLPGSVTDIGADAFKDCHKLTIHAPVGSYAETYAKENNIPFVAE